jgi:3-methyladenine DNA glycosylase AlkD
LTGVVRRSSDARLRDLAFQNIDKLKSERPILITKAVSWLLRSMLAHHRDAVASYLEAHAPTLPSLALRETRNKLMTGRK